MTRAQRETLELAVRILGDTEYSWVLKCKRIHDLTMWDIQSRTNTPGLFEVGTAARSLLFETFGVEPI